MGTESLRSRDLRSDHPSVRIHAGLGRQRLPEHEHQHVRRHAVQLRARVQHRARSRTSFPGPRCRPTISTEFADRTLGVLPTRPSRVSRRSLAFNNFACVAPEVRFNGTALHRHGCHNPTTQRAVRGHAAGRRRERRRSARSAMAPCYPQGDRPTERCTPHRTSHRELCTDELFQNGDLDFDGSPTAGGRPGSTADGEAPAPASFVEARSLPADRPYPAIRSCRPTSRSAVEPAV